MRRPSTPFHNQEHWALKYIIIINVGAFILQTVINNWFGSAIVENLFELSPKTLFMGFVWTLVTYSFLHGSVLHILVNMLMIYFIGRIIEPSIGTKRFLQLYFISVFLGALLWLTLSASNMAALVGASAAGFGLMTFFCLSQPDRPITLLLFFIIPLTLKPKWILWGMLGIEFFLFLFYELPGRSIVASSAHLGGILGGFISFQFITHKSIFSGIKRPTLFPTKWGSSGKSKKTYKSDFKINMNNKHALKKEVDRILDKINDQGFASLSSEEKKLLDKAKEILK